jgi:glycosyltransferase involved in cell wall biosynthesis
MKVAICVPRWADHGRRDQVWKFIHHWIGQNILPLTNIDDFTFTIIEGQAQDPGAARNDAATKAGNWDIALFWDADLLAHPMAVREAINRAAQNNIMVLAADSFMYMSQASSDRILAGEKHWFPQPYTLERTYREKSIFSRPCSGVYAVNRQLWELTGGFLNDCDNWGWEDLIFYEQVSIFGNGVQYVDDHILLHLWHPPAERTLPPGALPNHPTARRNYEIWKRLQRMRGAVYPHRRDPYQEQLRKQDSALQAKIANERARKQREEIKRYLATLGHEVGWQWTTTTT